jgi:adenylosuccinate synthase
LREASASLDGRAIGTTKKGIGPAYEDKARRTGIRAGELRDLNRLAERVSAALEAWAPMIVALGGQVPTVDSIVAPLEPLARRVVPMLAHTSALVDAAVRRGARVLFEGAQGTLLDVDHGTYPFVTSSSAVAGGAAIGSGIGPNRIDTVIGITKAYATRVGGGPFPTELDDSDGHHLRNVGAEFGSVTGRPRRTGWLDLPALRYAARVNGLDGLALTKLDVLTGLKRIRVCVAYDTPEGRTTELPIDWLDRPELAKPVYEELDGWNEPLESARVLDDLPATVRRYVRYLEEGAGVPLYLLSVGPHRRETIVLHNPFVGRAAAP